MPYPEEFFAVQLAFARKTADLRQQPYQETVLYNTAMYRILGLDWSFDPRNPIWQAYQSGLQQTDADLAWTYQFYLEHYNHTPEYNVPRWGCFSYEYNADTQILHMHFSGLLDGSGYGPLSSLRKDARLADLRSMFTHIQEKHPEARRVHGGSWLYNRKEYTRLFPPEYGQLTWADDAKRHLRARGLWGQFLRYNNMINERVSALFLERLEDLSDADECAQCFPYQPMSAEAPVELFYRFYGLEKLQ